MAKYKKGKDAKYADVVADDDDDVFPIARKIAEHTKEKDQEIHASFFELDGKPFSAINKTMLPIYIEDPHDYFDEFGFRKHDDEGPKSAGREEDSPSQSSSPLENSAHKMKFISHIQDLHKEVKDDVLWSHILGPELKTERFEELLKEGGIPHSMRPFLWPRLCGATKKQKEAKYTYESVLQQCAQDKPSIGVQIERDLLRTLPNNICFWKKNSEGIDALRRILKSVSFIYPDLGYCQGMGVIVASLLLYCSEESIFWMMTALIEDILPPNFYSQTLLGLQADERVTRHLMKCHVPDLNKALEDYEVEMNGCIVFSIELQHGNER
uniref:Rab-GAP TBC domain-containing protein n=1 Tax=Caenorhabditis japonica TaxID=281687 RepID=A0A8R1HSW1_CAEJA